MLFWDRQGKRLDDFAGSFVLLLGLGVESAEYILSLYPARRRECASPRVTL